MNHHTLFSSLATLLWLFGPAIGWAASPGDLVASFGQSGTATVDLSSQRLNLFPGPSALMPDGRIVVASQVTAASGVSKPGDLLIIRLLSNGALDPSFGTGGLVWLDLAPNALDEPVALLPVPGDGIILGARLGPLYLPQVIRPLVLPQLNAAALLALAKLDASGALAPSFSEDGIATTDLIATGGAESLALLGTNRIAAAGTKVTGGAAAISVAKVFLDDGTPDGATLSAEAGSGSGSVIVSMNDERIAAAGANATQMTVRRWTAGGLLEPEFQVGQMATPLKARVAADGALTVWAGSGSHCFQFGFAPDGTVDAARTKTEIINSGWATALALDAADRLLWQIRTENSASVQRMRPDFRTDASYGFWGRAPSLSTMALPSASSILALPDGDALLVGRLPALGPIYSRIRLIKLAAGDDRPVRVVKAGERLSPAAGGFPDQVTVTIVAAIGDSGGIISSERGIASGTLVSVGEATPDRPAVWRFPVRNAGSGPLSDLAVTLTEGSPHYSCSALPARLEPGEEAFVTVTLDPKQTGPLTGRVLIASNDPRGPFEIGFNGVGKLAAISFVNAEARGKESDGRISIPLRLDRPLNQEARVGVNLSLGSPSRLGSTAGRNDASLSGMAIFPPGTTEAAVDIDLQADGLPEGTEFTYVTLSTSTDLAIGERAYTTLVIEDDSYASFDRNELSVAEDSGLVQVPVSLNGPVDRDLLVPVRRENGFLGGTAALNEDFRIPGSQGGGGGAQQFILRFPRGETTAWLPLEILPDSAADDDETIYLSLVSPVIAPLNPPVERGPLPGTSLLTVWIREGSEGPPSFPFPFENAFLAAGRPAVLGGLVFGSRPISANWTLNEVPLRNATSTTLQIAPVRLADAGTYRLTVGNASGTVHAPPVTLSVVDTAAQPARVLGIGAELRLSAPAAGPGLSFRWCKDGSPIPVTDSRYQGISSETLVLSAAATPDSGAYTCEVSWQGRTLRTGDQPVFVVGTAPVLLPLEPATFVTGRPMSLRVPFDVAPLRYSTRLAITGLPRGLTFDPSSGLISGTAISPGDFSIAAVAFNPAGASNRIRSTLRFRHPFERFAGNWMAWVTASGDAADFDLGGRLNLTVTSSGAVSGSLQLGPDLHRWRGTLSEEQSDEEGVVLLETSIGRGQAKQALSLSLTLANDLVEGRLGVSVSPNVSGWRKVWKSDWAGRGAAARLAGAYAGYHLFSLPAHESLSISRSASLRTSTTHVGGDLAPELGTGFGSMVVGLGGSILFQGQTGDGQRFTASAPLGPEGQLGIFASTYGGRGSLCGSAAMSEDDHGIGPSFSGQTIAWTKRPGPSSTRMYPDGYGQWVNMEGGLYEPPADWSTLLCATGGTDASAYIHAPGVAAGSNPYTADFLSLPLRIEANSVTFPSEEFPRFNQFRFNPKTGFFTASIRYADHTIPCAGVFVNCTGAGYVRLPYLDPDSRNRIVHGTVRISADR